MPTSTYDPSTHDSSDPLHGVDHIIVIDNGAHNIRIASIPYPFPSDLLSPTVDPSILASSIPIDVFPNAIARTRTPHTIPASTSPTAPAPGSKTSLFVSSHIHTLLDDYAALHLRLPHQSGVIVDWAAQKQIWDHAFATHLAKLPGATGKKGKLLQGKAVILTETYCNVESVQYAMDLLLFEQYGAHAVWRTSAAGLVGLGTGVFRAPEPAVPEDDTHAEQDATMEHNQPSTSKRPARAPRTSTTTTNAAVPRILPAPLPQSLLVLDLGYSYCHAIPILHGQPHLPSIRRLDLGGKMLINLLKETLSFGQLDMMDESWLMSHIFARVSFVAASVGRRSSAGVSGKKAAEWSYEDLLALQREGGGGVGVTWSLPDYGGGGKGGEERDRARYGYIVDGPNPPHLDGEERRKRLRHDIDWDSAFIAFPSPTATRRRPSDDDEDTQTLHLSAERYSIMENLFNPTALSLDQQPLPLLIRDAVSSFAHSGLPHARAAADMMWSNIVLTGGLANCVGLQRRLEHELRSLAPADVGLRIWADEADASLTAIKAGMGVACEVAAKEAVRREASRGEDAKGGKKRGRKSRASVTVDETDEEVAGRWLTYAQWMNAAGGSEADIVRAANAVFYPPVEG